MKKQWRNSLAKIQLTFRKKSFSLHILCELKILESGIPRKCMKYYSYVPLWKNVLSLNLN